MDAIDFRHFAGRVRIERLRRGYSQRALARLAGTSNGYICNVERSRYRLGEKSMRRIAAALNLTLESLLP